MKKVLGSLFMLILIGIGIFAQARPNSNTLMQQNSLGIQEQRVQSRDRLHTQDIYMQQLRERDMMVQRIFNQDIQPVTVTGVVKSIIEKEAVIELNVQIDSEIYKVIVLKTLLSDIKPEENIELTGYKISVNDIKYFLANEITYQNETVNMQAFRKNFRTQLNENYKKYRDYQNYQKFKDYQDYQNYKRYRNYEDYRDYQNFRNYQQYNRQRYPEFLYYNY
ncbi:hypothetical protein [Petrotoga sp. 9PWA.NaAc.5.4]|uniref:hypothetical protein n=1 Tax=Petrotoga sp. 9PWA.NaAc.5.4 TaxID=1434328 RepID=UPI000CB23CE0|nr:hypothetical protein [Petrotoga sp. 9PWA.NaAc.5.4]PNR94858.1 hypothetical protein X924_05385 [Petrotoga sp. 9PWA.NaAc.5.4]